MISQLHRLLLELIPGGAKKALSAAQAKALLARVHPRDVSGKTRRRVAAELISDLERIHQRKEGRRQGTPRAADGHRQHADTAERHRAVRRCPAAGRSRQHHPVPDQDALRLVERYRAYRRLLRSASAPPAITRRQPANQPRAAHHGRRPAPTPRQQGPRLLRPQGRGRQDTNGSHALPQTKLSDVVYRQMAADARDTKTSPGGHSGTTLQSSVAGPTPAAGASDKPLPGPAAQQPKAVLQTAP
jgi:transposase